MTSIPHSTLVFALDTEISSIDCNNLEIRLNFENGIYVLDENGKEAYLSKPMQVVLTIDSYLKTYNHALEIKEYGKKIKYLEYERLRKKLQKESFGISMLYYSKFNNCILFDGGFTKENIMLSIEGIVDIRFQELKTELNH